MNQVIKKAFSSLVMVPKYGYHFPNPVSETHHKVNKHLILAWFNS